MNFDQIKQEIALLDDRQQAKLISYTLELCQREIGSADAVRQAMHRSPHLTSTDVAALEAAMEHAKISVSEPWSFNDRK